MVFTLLTHNFSFVCVGLRFNNGRFLCMNGGEDWAWGWKDVAKGYYVLFV